MIKELLLSIIDWEKVNNLLPVIIQDINSSEVLMLGYMNQEALDKTITTKKVTFYSRTKQRLWVKGETSKNYLILVDYTLDCDNDSLLILAKPEGKTCHLGSTSCFDKITNTTNWLFLNKLAKIIEERHKTNKSDSYDKSYTASLFKQGNKRIAQKVGEEGVEVALAAALQDKIEISNEAADLIYHLMVLLENNDLKLDDVINILKERNNQKGN